MAAQSTTPLLKVEGLKQYFRVNKNFTVKAVDDVSFEIYPGETYGLVGESGSGKTTIGRAIMRILPTSGGQVLYKGQQINGKISHALALTAGELVGIALGVLRGKADLGKDLFHLFAALCLRFA